MGSCASKFKLSGDHAKNAPAAAHNKHEFAPTISETKLVSLVQEKSMAEQHNLEISKGKDTDIIEETRGRSLSSLLHEEKGNVAVGVAGRSPEKIKHELQGSENIISEHDEAVHHIEAENSVPQKSSGVASIAVDETSEKKPVLPGEADAEKKHSNDTIITEAQKPRVSLTPEAVVEPSKDKKPVSVSSVSSSTNPHADNADTFVEDDARTPFSIPETPPMSQISQEKSSEARENTLSPALECVDTGIPMTGLVKGDSVDIEVPPCESKSTYKITGAKLCLTGDETPELRRDEFTETEEGSGAGALVTGESGNKNSKVNTVEVKSPEQIESPHEIDTAAESPKMQLPSVEGTSATTPESVETKSSEKEGGDLENKHLTQFEVSKSETGQKPGAETEHFKEKCSDMGEEVAQNQKTTGTEAAPGGPVGVEGEEGSPLLPDKEPSESCGGENHDLEARQLQD